MAGEVSLLLVAIHSPEGSHPCCILKGDLTSQTVLHLYIHLLNKCKHTTANKYLSRLVDQLHN